MKRPRGRPVGTGKREGEKFRPVMVKLPPELWAQLWERVPPGERSAFIRQAVEQALKQAD